VELMSLTARRSGDPAGAGLIPLGIVRFRGTSAVP
jgi:hypothetical protein